MPDPVLRLILIPSPLTGPGYWEPVSAALWARRQRNAVARLTDTAYLFPPYWITQSATVAASLPDEGDFILVAHSGSSVLLPAIGRFSRNRSKESRLRGYLFVDCDLPEHGRSRFDLFDDPADADRIRETTKDKWMPRWTSEDLAPYLPDATQRDAFVEHQPLIPTDLYEESIAVPTDWPEVPCAYLSLSEHYRRAVDLAHAADWPFARIDSHHFAAMTDPESVADHLMTLVDKILA